MKEDIKNLHEHLEKRSSSYKKWHENSDHRFIHYGLMFLCFSFYIWIIVVASQSQASTIASTPVPIYHGPVWVYCAPEGGICIFSGTHQVRYGGANIYVYKMATSWIDCSDTVFKYPYKNIATECAYSTVR